MQGTSPRPSPHTQNPHPRHPAMQAASSWPSVWHLDPCRPSLCTPAALSWAPCLHRPLSQRGPGGCDPKPPRQGPASLQDLLPGPFPHRLMFDLLPRGHLGSQGLCPLLQAPCPYTGGRRRSGAEFTEPGATSGLPQDAPISEKLTPQVPPLSGPIGRADPQGTGPAGLLSAAGAQHGLGVLTVSLSWSVASYDCPRVCLLPTAEH